MQTALHRNDVAGVSGADALLSEARRLADGFANRASDYDRAGRCPVDLLDQVFRAGLLALPVPKRLGGDGLGLAAAWPIIAELARGEPATALVTAMHYANMAAIARGRWPQGLGDKVARESLLHRTLINAAQAEPHVGSPSHGGIPETIARKEGSGWRITGRKRFCTGAPALHWILVSARTDEEDARIGSFLVAADAPGVSVVETWNATGMRATASHDVVLEDVPVPADGLVDARSIHMPLQRDPIGAAWHFCLTASVYLGIARSARDWLIDFARTFELVTVGGVLADQSSFRDGLGRIEVALATGRHVLRSIADLSDEGEIAVVDAASARHIVIDQAILVTSLALELAGNVGLSRDNPLERHHRDALCARAHAPNNLSIRNMAAAAALAQA